MSPSSIHSRSKQHREWHWIPTLGTLWPSPLGGLALVPGGGEGRGGPSGIPQQPTQSPRDRLPFPRPGPFYRGDNVRTQ